MNRIAGILILASLLCSACVSSPTIPAPAVNAPAPLATETATMPETAAVSPALTLPFPAPSPPSPAASGTPTPFPLPEPVQSGDAPVEHGSLYYETFGKGPVLVLIHDGLLNRRVWDGQIDAFQRAYRVVRYDRRGFGKSQAPQEPFSNVDDLRSLLVFLQVEHAVLMGISMGGGVAVDFALAYPEMVDGLVLVGPYLGGWIASSHFTQRNASNQTAADWANDPYLIAPGNDAARSRVLALLTENPPPGPAVARYRKPEPPSTRRLAEVNAKTLVLVGEADIPDVHANCGALQLGLPNARRIVLSGAGHLANLEQPVVFNRTVLDFLISLWR